jgi:hypothetical protein
MAAQVLNAASVTGIDYFLALGSVFNLEWHDQEPGSPPIASSQIKGLVTGVLRAGGSIEMYWVNEAFDLRIFDIDSSGIGFIDWGDGSTITITDHSPSSSQFTHTYTAVGLYHIAVKVNSSDTGANATRDMRIMYRSIAAAGDADWQWGDVPLPVEIDGTATGTMDSTFTFKVKLPLNTYDFPLSKLGRLYNRQGIGIFAQAYQDGADYGVLSLVAAGFVVNPSIEYQTDGAIVSANVVGPSYFLKCKMREMYFSDPGEIALMQLGPIANMTVNGVSVLYGNPLDNYVPQHWIKCTVDVACAHIIQHLRVYTSAPGAPGTPTNPTLAACQGTNPYGTLAQFLNFEVEVDFDEYDGKQNSNVGFSDMSFTDGEVLSNVRQGLANKGNRFYDRHGGTMRLDKMPQYRAVQPAADLQIDNLYQAFPGTTIDPGEEVHIAQLIIQRPNLAFPTTATYSADYTVGGTTVNSRDPYSAIVANGGSVPISTYSTIYNDATAAGTAGVDQGFSDSGNNIVIDLSKYEYRFPTTARSFGEYYRVDRVYTEDLVAFATGKDKELRTRLTVNLAAGQMIGLGCGSMVALTHTEANLGISWTNKLFEIQSIVSMELVKGYLFCVYLLVECDPDDQPSSS